MTESNIKNDNAQGPLAPATFSAYGIIDPDYARVFTHARIIAWQFGYACLAHGSFTRDLDLLLMPWTENACAGTIEGIVRRIADVAGLTLQGEPSDKPHGRKAWTLLFPGFNDPRWVDVSAFTPNSLEEHARKLELELKEATEWRDKWKASTEQATLVHEEISRITGIKCLPSQMPRFLAERLAAPPVVGFGDALRIARGCTNYGGGHHFDGHMEAYQHGIQTVINALESAEKTGLNEIQVRMLWRMGAERELSEALDRINTRYGSLGAFLDEEQKRCDL